jgi:hypothetical protein
MTADDGTDVFLGHGRTGQVIRHQQSARGKTLAVDQRRTRAPNSEYADHHQLHLSYPPQGLRCELVTKISNLSLDT